MHISRIASAAIVLLLAPAAPAQDSVARWFSPVMGRQQVWIRYDVDSYFNADVGGQRDQLHMVRHDFRFSVPVWQDERNELALGASVRALDVDTGAILPNTWSEFPAPLWDVRLHGTYRHMFDNGWIAGGDLQLGSASDKPFASWDEFVVSATGFLRIPQGERNAWLILLNYANNREFWENIPIPGVAYQWSPDDRLRAVLGVPYTSLFWQPIERVELEGYFFVPRTVHATVGYRVVENVKLYAGFDWQNERYFRSTRRDDDDRLFYYDKRVMGGVRWDITANVWVDFAGGWAFDRFFFEGEEYDDRGHNRLDLDDGPMLTLQVGVRL